MRFSVITVCYNSANCITKTINSVLRQSCNDYEYIIIDGQSLDGTQCIINNLKNDHIQVLSEKDYGIYDAMNKGINMAKGDYIIFMNAGDCFSDNKVLEDVDTFFKMNKAVDVLYGDAILVASDKVKLYKPLPLGRLKYGMIASHQSTFVRTAVLKSNLFNLQYKLAADYNQLSDLYLKGFSFKYVNRSIAKVTADEGYTFDNFIHSKKEVLNVQKKRKLRVALLVFFYEITRFKCVMIYKRVKFFFVSIFFDRKAIRIY